MDCCPLLHNTMTQKTIQDGVEHPYCNPSSLITDFYSGELICSDCGLVVVERMEDQRKEWRSFAEGGSERDRVGPGISFSFNGIGLSTIIGNYRKDFAGKPFSLAMKRTIDRLRILDNRSKTRTSSDRNLYKVFYEFEKLKSKLALSDAIIDKAAYNYQKAVAKKLTRGRNVVCLAAACLYAACRECEANRTIEEISDAINAKKTNVSSYFRVIVNELGLTLPVMNPVQCIARIANNTGVSEKVKRHAIQILREAERLNLVAGKDPMGLAAAAIYVAGTDIGEYHSQKILSESARTSSVTIRNRSNDLRKLQIARDFQ